MFDTILTCPPAFPAPSLPPLGAGRPTPRGERCRFLQCGAVSKGYRLLSLFCSPSPKRGIWQFTPFPGFRKRFRKLVSLQVAFGTPRPAQSHDASARRARKARARREDLAPRPTRVRASLGTDTSPARIQRRPRGLPLRGARPRTSGRARTSACAGPNIRKPRWRLWSPPP